MREDRRGATHPKLSAREEWKEEQDVAMSSGLGTAG